MGTKRKKTTHPWKIVVPAVVAVLLAASNAMILYAILTDDVSAEIRARAVPVARFEPYLDVAVPDLETEIGEPVRIEIPSIGVKASIVNVALASDGSMDVPRRPLDAAWYMLGPKPGETGSAVIAGHVDWLRGEDGAFKRLRALKPGDTVRVRDDSGTIIPFVVRASRKYDAADDATEVFTSSDGKAHLNLITCEGGWDASAGQYSERLVVFADKAE